MDAFLSEHPASRIAEWEAFYALEPWGCEVEDRRAGTLASWAVAPHLGKGQKAPHPDEIFPSRAERLTPKEMHPLDDEQVDRVFGKLRVIEVAP